MKQGLQSAALLLGCIFSLLFFSPAQAKGKLVIFGDSLSDNGNTTHLLKTLREEESAHFLVQPLEKYVIDRLERFGRKNHTPKLLTDWLKKGTNVFFDKGVGPLVVKLVLTIQKVPLLPNAPYWKNHFSNGETWSEHLAKMTGFDISDPRQYENHAFGGSWAKTIDSHVSILQLLAKPKSFLSSIVKGKLIPPSLGLVVSAYLMENEKLSGQEIYFLFSGGNDYLNMLSKQQNYEHHQQQRYIKNVVSSIRESAEKLVKAGAKQVVLIGVPDIGISPYFLPTSDSAMMSAISHHHNEQLKEQTKQLKHLYPNAMFSFIDIQSFMYRIIHAHKQYGLKDTTHACIDVRVDLKKNHYNDINKVFGGNHVLSQLAKFERARKKLATNIHQCSEPNSYLFWDDVHPTTVGHAFLAGYMCKQLKKEKYLSTCENLV